MKKIISLIFLTIFMFSLSVLFTACGHTHVFDQQVEREDLKVSDATCEVGTKYFLTCECGEIGTETFESDDAKGHVFDQKVETEDYLSEPATDSTTAKYFYSCACGEKGEELFEKAKQEVNIDLSSCDLVSGHNKIYDGTYVPKITAEGLGLDNGTTIATYYKAKDADDTAYSTSRVEDAGLYTCKIVISETTETLPKEITFDFEIEKRVVTLSSGTTVINYTGKTSTTIAPSNYFYSSIIKSDGNVTCNVQFASKNVGVYSVEDGTLTVEPVFNHNYKFVGSIKIKPMSLISSDGPITIQREVGKTYYTVDLAEQGICVKGDDVKAGIYVYGELATGVYDLYWKAPGGNGVWLPRPNSNRPTDGIYGADAKNYIFEEKSGTAFYYMKAKIIAPAE